MTTELQISLLTSPAFEALPELQLRKDMKDFHDVKGSQENPSFNLVPVPSTGMEDLVGIFIFCDVNDGPTQPLIHLTQLFKMSATLALSQQNRLPRLHIFLQAEAVPPEPVSLAEMAQFHIRCSELLRLLGELESRQPGCVTRLRGHRVPSFLDHLDALAAAFVTDPLDPGLRDYLTRLYADTSCIRLPGIGDGARVETIELREIFVRLEAQHREINREQQGWAGREETMAHEPNTADVLSLLEHGPRLVVIGDPGSGKTTLLRYLAARTAAGHLNGQDQEKAHQLWAKVPTYNGELPIPFFLTCSQVLEHLESDKTPRGSEVLRLLEEEARIPHGIETFFKENQAALFVDGLDEVSTKEARQRVCWAVEAFLAKCCHRDCLVMLTCRTRAFQRRFLHKERARFTAFRVKEMDVTQCRAFLNKWFAAVEPIYQAMGSPLEVGISAKVASEIEAHDHIQDMASNPNVLTLLAIIRLSSGKMPEMRVELYQQALELFLSKKDRDRRVTRNLEDWEQRVVMETLKVLAWGLHLDKQDSEHHEKEVVIFGEQSVLDRLEERIEADEESKNLSRGARDQKKRKLLQWLEVRSGLLYRRDGAEGHQTQLRFSHHGYREYLAALCLVEKFERGEIAAFFEKNILKDWWHEPIMLALSDLGRSQYPLFSNVVKVLLAGGDKEPIDWSRHGRGVALAMNAVADLEAAGKPVDAELATRVRREVSAVTENPEEMCVQDRIEAVAALGVVGDPRLGMHKRDRWVEIEPGQFLMGGEQESQTVRVTQPFWMGKYPVTEIEYLAFVRKGGYEDSRWWGDAGWDWLQSEKEGRFEAWLEKQKQQNPEYDFWAEDWFRPSKAPRFWGAGNRPEKKDHNLPVVGVNWYEACAYCRWLEAHFKNNRPLWWPSSMAVGLPSEAQWEYAAKGKEGRPYPWGDDPPTEEMANFDGSQSGPTPVGIYPRGATPTKLFDMAGNVWEWCVDNFVSDIYNKRNVSKAETPVIIEDSTVRVLRGGAWRGGATRLRSSYRFRNRAARRGNVIGFRCVLWLPPELGS
ncbi:SUMF1/EgtB/PvdO family nonheme iron enzyme [Sulfidibacter corallicola]|uniref:SUMF1/EgtB/PvdO family nonheme iron enzyme n=1 Tax=Sulfidibacter corallicola TaxID=2818388 RepID=A0A8A4TLT4_SULCO|nr:SUMF1/EgtB/PvdO family nonheme iron enzyme [Sulfidibacter corallicola]QTD50916.1 SUMF1/EgtB/PvdO family nonheme iron enzyme [Sulfidibacter corallicola]